MHPDVYTPAAINSYIFSSNIRALITSVFAFFCIFAILRHSSCTMEKGYRLHLLNMTITILFCDIVISILCRPYPLLPLTGVCLVGELNGILLERASVESVVTFYRIIFMYFLMSSMATVCNATIHRYLFVTELIGQKHNKHSKFYVSAFMYFLQILWPLIGVLLMFDMDIRPASVVEESKKLYPEIYQATMGQPCVFVVTSAVEWISVYLPLSFIALSHMLFCAVANFALLFVCWRKILNAKLGTISKRTLKMQQKLLISVSVQSILPYIVFLSSTMTFIFGFFFEFNFTKALTNQVFLYLSLHSVINCLVIFGTIPTYSKGLLDDFRFLFSCGKYRPTDNTVTTNISFAKSSRKIFPVLFFKRIKK